MGLFSRSNTTTVAPPAAGGTAVLTPPPAADLAAPTTPPTPPPAPPKSGGLFTSSPGSSPGSPSLAGVARMTAAAPNAMTASSNVAPIQSERQMYLTQLKVKIHQKLVERLDVQNLRTLPPETVRGEVRLLVRELCQSEKGLITAQDQDRLMDDIMDETFGLGPLETLLKDPTISDIMVNRCDRIFVERKGRIELVDTRFRDNAHLRQIIDRIVGLVGRRVDETSPMVDARLSDGSRVNAIIPPLALDGRP